jgi:hypothetical protein
LSTTTESPSRSGAGVPSALAAPAAQALARIANAANGIRYGILVLVVLVVVIVVILSWGVAGAPVTLRTTE